MGLLIERAQFEDAEYARFSERLTESLDVLDATLRRKGFGQGPITIGGELELFLVGADGAPACCNLEVVEACQDRRVTVEINRYNLELNLTPAPLAGRPFTALLRDAEDAFGRVRHAAGKHGAKPVAIGILPTLRAADLGLGAITPLPRYDALNQGIQRCRGEAPLHISVAGEEVLNLESEDVSPEGANTSAQFHLKVPPAEFAATFNAAQLATAPVLAFCGNSPFFLGRSLWEETRIALFQQATDDRGLLTDEWAPLPRVSFGRGWARQGALELFAEGVALHRPLLPVMSSENPREALAAGRVPLLEELRLHHGTVWRWNRPVYDPKDGGHLRLELRALPAGPTLADTMANGLVLIGLTLGLAPQMERLLPGLPFPYARENFHRAARQGVDTVLLWPSQKAPSPSLVPATELLPFLLDTAADGLSRAGVEAAEISRVLSIFRARAESGRTGARWQRRMLKSYERDLGRGDALRAVLQRYIQNQEADRPVHTWDESA